MRLAMLTLAMIFGMMIPAALAESNPVITINPDGSITVVGDMPQAAPAPAPVEAVSPPSVPAPVPPAKMAVLPETPEIPPVMQAPPIPRAKPAPAPVRQAKTKAPASVPPISTGQADITLEAMPQSGPVTSADARRIALAIAPPSRSVNVYPADYQGLKVYQVVFKTEHGEQYVLVDRQNGEIVPEKKGKRK